MRHSFSRAFSLVELMIVVAIVAIIGALLIPALGSGCVTTDARQGSAEANLSAWSTQVGLEGRGTCSGADSDHDGYTSCTFVQADGNIQALECGYDVIVAPLGQNTGCKVALPKMRVTDNQYQP